MDFGFDLINEIIHKAREIDPKNLIYQWNYYRGLDFHKKESRNMFFNYMNILMDKESVMRKELADRGSQGEYLLDIMLRAGDNILTYITCVDENKLTYVRAFHVSKRFLSSPNNS